MTASTSASATVLRPLARWTRMAAALAFAAVSLFLLWEAGLESWSAITPTPEGTVRRSPQSPPLGPSALVNALASPSALPSAAPDSPSSPRQILVDLGPPRSEVFVDGRRVGQTPFLGQVRCRPGREISIHVIPERGLPLEEKRLCPP